MSVLSSLAGRHARLAAAGEVPRFGYSTENIGFIVVLNEEGEPVGLPIDWRQGEGRKRRSRPMAVPAPAKRTSGVAANFLWDKTSYALGVTAGEGRRLAEEHAAFKTRLKEGLAGQDDLGLKALLRFAETWTPEAFERLGWPEEMKDQNVVFALEDEYRDRMIHDREAAIALWASLQAAGSGDGAICLITGLKGPIARLHPAIKGVWGAQSSGASLVSFNLDAFTSYGHEQGDNAPVSELAAAEYGAVLNHLLRQNSPNRIQIGDASTVFWAEGPDQGDVEVAENLFAVVNTDPSRIDESVEAGKVGIILGKIRQGLPVASIVPDLPEHVRFYVLGLAPNAARLSVRFFIEDDFAVLGRRYLEHLERLRIVPGDTRVPQPPLWRLLIETASLRKRENVPPNLAGEWLRAILTGHPYPLTLLSTTLMRIRSDGDVNALRVAILKSLLIRNFHFTEQEAPVAFDPDNRKLGYLLGRLFATYEQVQGAALGRVNASVRDKFYASASSTPRRVFNLLDKGSANHIGKLRKERPGQAVNLEKLLGAIMEHFDPAGDPFPEFLPQEDQGLFALGYYQQRSQFFKTRDDAATTSEEPTT